MHSRVSENFPPQNNSVRFFTIVWDQIEEEGGEFCILGSFQFRKLLLSRYTPQSRYTPHPIGDCLPNEIYVDEGETNAVLDERNTDEQDVMNLRGEWAQLTVSTGNGNLPNLEKEWHTVKSFNTNYTKNLVLCGH